MKDKIGKIIFICTLSICLLGCNSIKDIINDFSGNRDFEEKLKSGENESSMEDLQSSEESIIINDKNYESSIDEWVNITKNDEYIITIIGTTTCPHCTNYKPVFENVIKNYDTEYIWFYVDKLDDSEYDILTSTYNLENYEGAVPYTFITKNGKFISDKIGELDEKTLKEFLGIYLK